VQEFNFTFLGERVYMSKKSDGYKGGAKGEQLFAFSAFVMDSCTVPVLYYDSRLGIGDS